MEYFWYTGYFIPEGHGFKMYSAGHIIWLLALAVICAVLLPLHRKMSEHGRMAVRRTVALLLLIDELFKDVAAAIIGQFSLDLLPFHVCSINIFLIIADAIRPRKALREILYAVCLPGAFFALLFPGWNALPIVNAFCFHSFTVHILLFIYPCLVLCEGFVPSFGRFIGILPLCLPVVVAVYFFNKAFGTNFMFLSSPGSGNPLSLFESVLGNPGYLIGLPILCAAIWAVLYGIPALMRKARHRKTQSSI